MTDYISPVYDDVPISKWVQDIHRMKANELKSLIKKKEESLLLISYVDVDGCSSSLHQQVREETSRLKKKLSALHRTKLLNSPIKDNRDANT